MGQGRDGKFHLFLFFLFEPFPYEVDFKLESTFLCTISLLYCLDCKNTFISGVNSECLLLTVMIMMLCKLIIFTVLVTGAISIQPKDGQFR